MARPKPIRSIHPFPARMAPEIALTSINDLPKGSKILDPMAGSGTVLRQATLLGHKAYGYDLDPMSVILSRAWSSKINPGEFEKVCLQILKKSQSMKVSSARLPWIDDDKDTQKFIKFWFAAKQANPLRRLAHVILKQKNKLHPNMYCAIQVAFSRLIITKHKGASLAWDVSHSRPHKVRETNDFDVFAEFEKAVKHVSRRFQEEPLRRSAKIYHGDARNMGKIKDGSIDAILTSPPYLNAIDYMRGHKLALVWFGYTVGNLRELRSQGIGTERTKKGIVRDSNKYVAKATVLKNMTNRQKRLIEQYAWDAHVFMAEVARVLKPGGVATFVIGNSCLQGQHIKNSTIFREAAKHYGLRLIKTRKRPIPVTRRYLPTPKENENALAKRMREEVIMTFQF